LVEQRRFELPVLSGLFRLRKGAEVRPFSASGQLALDHLLSISIILDDGEDEAGDRGEVGVAHPRDLRQSRHQARQHGALPGLTS